MNLSGIVCGLVLTLVGGGLVRSAAADATTVPPAGELKDPVGREKIEQALPAKALAVPTKPRRLLIFDGNVGYGGSARQVRAVSNPGLNQPGAVGNRRADPGLNQPGAAGNVGRDPGFTSPAPRAIAGGEVTGLATWGSRP